MSSLAQSGLTSLMQGVEALGGARILMIGAHKPERAKDKLASYTKGLTLEDRDLLLSKVPYIGSSSIYSAIGRKDVVGDTGVIARTDFVAASSDYLETFSLQIEKGRMFSAEEEHRHDHVCVVGFKVAKDLFDGDAVGHSLTIANERCKIVGQLTNNDFMGENWGFDWLDHVVLPRETALDVQHDEVMGESVFIFKTDAPAHNEIAKRIANALLEERHHGVDDYQIWDFNKLLAKFKTTFAIMEVLVGFIAGIALFVGGVGVMNMMLVSVSERVREIGIRKALGASPRDIGAQFLVEAVLLSSSGGLIGVTSGIAATVGASALIHHFKASWIGELSVPAVTVALGVSIAVGVVFGYFPARRAGRLDAILAIRT
jgi:putative ABC transport system permease protein